MFAVDFPVFAFIFIIYVIFLIILSFRYVGVKLGPITRRQEFYEDLQMEKDGRVKKRFGPFEWYSDEFRVRKEDYD